MNEDELREIIDNGQRLLNIEMSSVREPIVQYSVGVASVCHQLALNLCLEENIQATIRRRHRFQAEDLQPALERYVRESSDTLKAAFELALKRHKVRKYDNCQLILTALAGGSLIGMRHAEILNSIREVHSEYPAGNLTSYLQELQTEDRGAILRCGADRRYRFIDPLHHTYAQVTLMPERVPSKADTPGNELETYVRQALEQRVTIDPPRYGPRRRAARFLAEVSGSPRQQGLTLREAEVVILIADGHRPSEVADDLGLARSRIYAYISSAMKKLAVETIDELIQFAQKAEREVNRQLSLFDRNA
jgi:DNA-binding CsgD family transcriptional regulator